MIYFTASNYYSTITPIGPFRLYFHFHWLISLLDTDMYLTDFRSPLSFLTSLSLTSILLIYLFGARVCTAHTSVHGSLSLAHDITNLLSPEITPVLSV